MRFFNKALVAFFALAILASPAWAATKEGDKEVAAYASISNTEASVDGGDTTTITVTTLQGSFGYFQTKSLQIGAAVLQQNSSISIPGTDTQTNGVTFLEGFVKYHFNPDTDTVPYVGAMVGTVSVNAGSESGSGTTIGAMAGVKFFMSADLSVNGEYSIRNYTVSIAGVDASSTTGTLSLGLSYYFR